MGGNNVQQSTAPNKHLGKRINGDPHDEDKFGTNLHTICVHGV